MLRGSKEGPVETSVKSEDIGKGSFQAPLIFLSSQLNKLASQAPAGREEGEGKARGGEAGRKPCTADPQHTGSCRHLSLRSHPVMDSKEKKGQSEKEKGEETQGNCRPNQPVANSSS